MFESNKKEIVSFMHNMDIDYDNQREEFNDELNTILYEQIHEKHIQDVTMEHWSAIQHDSRYQQLLDRIKTHLNIPDNEDIQEDIKLKSCYWGDDNTHCNCINDHCSINCDNGKMWYAEDLDDYFGFEQYKYELILGGPNHGTFIVHSNHPDNNIDEDVELDIFKYFGRDYECIHYIKNYVQDAYDRNSSLHRKSTVKRGKFKLFQQKYRISQILELYDMLKKYYTEFIGYNTVSRKFTKVFINKLDAIIKEALTIRETSTDNELHEIIESLKIKTDKLKGDVNMWLYTSNIALKENFTPDINNCIINYI